MNSDTASPDAPSSSDSRRREDLAPRIYLITDRAIAGERGVVEAVRLALSAVAPGSGVDREGPAEDVLLPRQVAVQLREKDLGGRALLELGQALRAVTAAAGARLFVNDRVDVALAIGADGIHLPGGALSPAEVKRLGPHLQVGVSTHTSGEVARAAENPDVTFVVFGPVFETLSKRASGHSAVGLPALARAAEYAIPVVALGGIDARTALACARAGAHGLGCIRSVLGAEDPPGALTKMWSAWCGKGRIPP